MNPCGSSVEIHCREYGSPSAWRPPRLGEAEFCRELLTWCTPERSAAIIDERRRARGLVAEPVPLGSTGIDPSGVVGSMFAI